MAHCGWYRPSLIWAVMLGETESMPDWCLSNPLVGWLLASHTAGCRPSVCVMTALWKNHYCRGLTSVVIKLHHSTEKGGQSYNLSHMIDIKRRKAMSVTLYIHMHPGEVNHKIQGKKITSKMLKKRKDKEKKMYSWHRLSFCFVHGVKGSLRTVVSVQSIYSSMWPGHSFLCPLKECIMPNDMSRVK